MTPSLKVVTLKATPLMAAVSGEIEEGSTDTAYSLDLEFDEEAAE